MPTLNEARFTAFHARHARDLWAYAYRVTGDAADAEDIVQEAFLRLLRATPDTDDDEQLRKFVFRIASNLLVDRWRKARAGRESRMAPVSVPPHDANDDVARTFGELMPRERALLWLAYVEEESHQAIADALGVGRGSIKVLLFRAKKRLRDLLHARGLARM